MKAKLFTCAGTFSALVLVATVAGLVGGWVDREYGGHLQTALIGAVLMFAGSTFRAV